MALMPVADALQAVLDGAIGLPEEHVVLDDARGRVLTRDVRALRTQPPDDMSAMDGYAVRATDATLSARLKVIGEVAAGRPSSRRVRTRSSSRRTPRATAKSSPSVRRRAPESTSVAPASIFEKTMCF